MVLRAQEVVLNAILLWSSTPKSETMQKKWVCGVIRDSSIYITPVCDEEPAAVFLDAALSELLPRYEKLCS